MNGSATGAGTSAATQSGNSQTSWEAEERRSRRKARIGRGMIGGNENDTFVHIVGEYLVGWSREFLVIELFISRSADHRRWRLGISHLFALPVSLGLLRTSNAREALPIRTRGRSWVDAFIIAL